MSHEAIENPVIHLQLSTSKSIKEPGKSSKDSTQLK